MRIFFLCTFLVLLSLPSLAFQNKLTLDDIFSSNKFRGSTVADVQWLPDGSAFAFTRVNGRTGQTDIYRHDVRSGQETLILQGDQLRIGGAPVTMTAYQTTGQQNLLLITGERRQIWRHSYAAPYYLYDVRSQSLTPLAGGDPDLQNVALSPHGRLVAYVKDSNLFVAPVDGGTPQQLTSDGGDQILNGIFDWVYEEEFGRPDAFRWSPDSRRIAFWRTDQTRVKTFYMIDELEPYSKITPLKYPKVGEQTPSSKSAWST
jgi:dipeptidyl-peptidase-4